MVQDAAAAGAGEDEPDELDELDDEELSFEPLEDESDLLDSLLAATPPPPEGANRDRTRAARRCRGRGAPLRATPRLRG